MTRSALLCEHANEMPHECPCDLDCYCKEHACASPSRNARYPVPGPNVADRKVGTSPDLSEEVVWDRFLAQVEKDLRVGVPYLRVKREDNVFFWKTAYAAWGIRIVPEQRQGLDLRVEEVWLRNGGGWEWNHATPTYVPYPQGAEGYTSVFVVIWDSVFNLLRGSMGSITRAWAHTRTMPAPNRFDRI